MLGDFLDGVVSGGVITTQSPTSSDITMAVIRAYVAGKRYLFIGCKNSNIITAVSNLFTGYECGLGIVHFLGNALHV